MFAARRAQVEGNANRQVVAENTHEHALAAPDRLDGFPKPMTNPPERSRQSISLFYWSPDPEALFISFLPGSRNTRTKAMLRSFIPPAAYTARNAVRILLRGRQGGGAK